MTMSTLEWHGYLQRKTTVNVRQSGVPKMRYIMVVILLSLFGAANAETVFIPATQDNTLYQDPEGKLSNGKGDFLFSGRIEDGPSRKSVIAFKDLSAIPYGAVVQTVKLHLQVSEVSGPTTEIYLLRILENWGEGASNAPDQEYMGAPAAPGDATWVHTFYDQQSWDYVGGVFAWWPSDLESISTPKSYTFGSTYEMVNDVQTWKTYPGENFGWILIGSSDTDSLIQLHSRENMVSPPLLEVTYTATGSASSDYSGVWHDPDKDGEGYGVFQTPFGWLVYYYGYSSAGEFMWLTSDLVRLDELEQGIPFELPMLINVPGTFEEPTPASMLQPYGSLELLLNSCTEGVFKLDGPDGMKTSNVIRLVGIDNTICLNDASP